MAKRVLVTGASGFVGKAVVRELVLRGWEVRALVNRAAVVADGVTSFSGGLFDAAALARAMEGCSAVVHLVGIIAERPKAGVTFRRIHVQGTAAVIAAAKSAGVEQFVHMSALGAAADAEAEYHRTKAEAEALVRGSGLCYTIFRPGMILGKEGEFTRMMIGWAKGTELPYVVMPYFAPGVLGWGRAGLVQPVDVRDVAWAFAESLDRPAAGWSSFDLAGRQAMSWREMYAKVGGAVAWRVFGSQARGSKPAVAVPHWYALLLTRLVPAGLLPFNRDQVLMSKMDVTADIGRAERVLGYCPRGMDEIVGDLL
jgi:NADH dehydrogenase